MSWTRDAWRQAFPLMETAVKELKYNTRAQGWQAILLYTSALWIGHRLTQRNEIEQSKLDEKKRHHQHQEKLLSQYLREVRSDKGRLQ